MSFTIRTATEADIPAMDPIRRAVLENQLFDPARVTEADYLHYVTADTAWVANSGASIAGFAAIDVPAKNVWALFVLPAAEGKGIGRALHDAMLKYAEKQAIDALWLTTGEGTRAERFYITSGWTRAGKSRDGEIRFERRFPSAAPSGSARSAISFRPSA